MKRNVVILTEGKDLYLSLKNNGNFTFSDIRHVEQNK